MSDLNQKLHHFVDKVTGQETHQYHERGPGYTGDAGSHGSHGMHLPGTGGHAHHGHAGTGFTHGADVGSHGTHTGGIGSTLGGTPPTTYYESGSRGVDYAPDANQQGLTSGGGLGGLGGPTTGTTASTHGAGYPSGHHESTADKLKHKMEKIGDKITGNPTPDSRYTTDPGTGSHFR